MENIQSNTSEIIKIALIIFTASFINNYKRKISDFNFMQLMKTLKLTPLSTPFRE